MKKANLLFPVFLIFYAISAFIPISSIIKENIKSQIQQLNEKQSQAYLNSDKVRLMQMYATDAVCLPEYHSPLYQKADIEQYFTKFFQNAQIELFKKEIYEVTLMGNMISEIGTYQLKQKSKETINGKYLIIWEKDKNGVLKINAEAWGAVKYIDRNQVPYAQNPRIESIPNIKVRASQKIIKELAQQNDFINQTVAGRDGGRHAEAFSDDAIFMHYYQPMIIGKENIKTYLIGHESPNVKLDSLQIRASKIQDLGRFVIEHGYYSVNWSDGTNGGKSIGKSINIWKRDENGVLKVYRQMVNHD
jgi:ketosteroid isomerase-like protein